jgi:hypothetical protein
MEAMYLREANSRSLTVVVGTGWAVVDVRPEGEITIGAEVDGVIVDAEVFK